MVRAEAGATATTREVVDRLATYAALVRVPNLFTAPPDVVLGVALAVAAGTVTGTPASGGVSASPVAVGGAAVASMLLYAGGTTLNDYFDAPIDAEERPERPIPSGIVHRRRALVLGLSFLAGGVLVASASADRTGIVAAVLAVVVLLYDGWLKDGAAGFLAMGAARGLDVLLGVAVVADPLGLAPWALAVPFVVAGYIAAVTAMAAGESTGTDRRRVAIATGAAALAAIAVPIALLAADAGITRLGVGVVLSAGYLVWVGRPLRAAYADPTPGTVGPAVGACVVGIVVLDGAFAAVAGVPWSVLALAFLLPTLGLSRTFDVT